VTLDRAEDLGRIFTGPRRTRWLLPLLRALPPSAASRLLGVAAVGQAVFRDHRARRAWTWAGAQGFAGPARCRVTLATLANHGRYVAQEAMLGIEELALLHATSTIVGREHLDAARTGALLLGVHVGPPRGWLYLRAHGYPVRAAIRDTAGEGVGWNRWRDEQTVVTFSLGDPSARVAALYRLRRLLARGEMVFLAADGPFGEAQFSLDLPGASHAIRSGWFTLRRALKVPVFPVLTHEERGRRIVTVHAPLPMPDNEIAADAEMCRVRLTDLVREYVRRYPTQCRYLAFPPWT
jgi:lauroyl/myristoyl acyltransferase